MGKKKFGVEIKTAGWVPVDKALFIMNGVDAVVKLDGTNKEVRKTIKKPKMVTVHLGEATYLKKLKGKS